MINVSLRSSPPSNDILGSLKRESGLACVLYSCGCNDLIKSPKFTVIGVGGAGNASCCGGAGNASGGGGGAVGAGGGAVGAVICGIYPCVVAWDNVITGVAVGLSLHNEKRPDCSLI